MSDLPVSERVTAALADRYTIERELGEGGMATVYLAKDLKHNRKVAIKVLKPELAAVVGAERFLAEIETTANLRPLSRWKTHWKLCRAAFPKDLLWPACSPAWIFPPIALWLSETG